MRNKKTRTIYIIGIGGKGLNAIAEFCLARGYTVSGSDMRQSAETDALRAKGARIAFEQVAENITSAYDLVVYSSIIQEDHPELRRARELGIPVKSRAEFLADITGHYVRISVAGSHGKSTTSALAALALRAQASSVNAITGAHIKELNSYQCSGPSPYCVLEACEYGESFVHIPGTYSIITSLEKSHMEYFGTEERMNDAFRKFIAAHDTDACLIIDGDNYVLRELASAHAGTVRTCGFNSANDYVIRDVELRQAGSVFSLYKGDKAVAEQVVLRVPGMYNVHNAAYVLVLLTELGLGHEHFIHTLASFTGVGRRFEIRNHNQTVFVDDFAHHPTQVRNLIKGLRQFYPDKDILAVFEPRQFHLIRTFLREYGKAFEHATEVCVTDVLPALGDTEEDKRSLSVQDVLQSVAMYAKPARTWHGSSYEDIARQIGVRDLSKTVVATIGAGSVFRVRDLLVNGVQ